MMYCSYHSKNPAVVQCNQCSRPLCAACDHRIRGFPFCQDCIVMGVEMLRQQSQTPASYVVRRKSSPFVATDFSLPASNAASTSRSSALSFVIALFLPLITLMEKVGEPAGNETGGGGSE